MIRVDAKNKKHIRDFRFDKDEHQTRIQKVGEHIFVSYCNNGKLLHISAAGRASPQACAVF